MTTLLVPLWNCSLNRPDFKILPFGYYKSIGEAKGEEVCSLIQGHARKESLMHIKDALLLSKLVHIVS